jgi:hypothetical protein
MPDLRIATPFAYSIYAQDFLQLHKFPTGCATTWESLLEDFLTACTDSGFNNAEGA